MSNGDTVSGKVSPEAEVLGTQEQTSIILEDMPDFDDQCFLLEYAPTAYARLGRLPPLEGGPTEVVRDLAQFKASAAAKSTTNLEYITDITIESGGPTDTTFQNFFEITPHQTAQITPLIQIAVDSYKKGGGMINRVYFDFANETTFLSSRNNALKDLRTSGKRNLAGIKNVSVTLDGVDAATSKLVTINASFVFQDFRAIFDPSADIKLEGTTIRRTYSDLFSYNVKSIDHANVYKKLNFTIGWSAKNSLSRKLGLGTKQLELDAQIVKYNFDFKEDGSVVVNVTYKGLIETLFDGPESNVLSLVKADVTAMHTARSQRLELEAADLITQNQKALRANQLEEIALNLWTVRFHEMMDGKIPGVAPPTWTTGTGVDIRGSANSWRWPEHAGSETYGGVKGNYIGGPFVDKSHDSGSVWTGKGLATATLLDWMATNPVIAAQMESISAPDRRTIAHQIQQQYGSMLGQGNTTWADGRNVGMHKNEFEAYKNTHLGGRHETNTENREQLQKNIQEAGANALKSILNQISLVKFEGLRQLTHTLLRNQRVYLAKLSGNDKLDLQRNLVTPGGIREVFMGGGTSTCADGACPGLILQHARILSMQPTGWATEEGTESGGGLNQAVTREQLMKGFYQLIPFVFLGDFLKGILELPTDRNNPNQTVADLIGDTYGQKFNVDLGYIYFKGPFTGEPEKLPLYYLPLSLKKLNNFFARDIIGKERTFFSFKQFVMAILQQFLLGAYNNCRRNSMLDSIQLPKLDFVHGTKGKGNKKTKIWFIYGTQNTTHEIPDKPIWGVYSENLKRKIAHFYLGGQNKGILQSIKIMDNTNPDLKTAIYLKTKTSNPDDVDGSDQGLLPPLVYKLEIKTVGCSTFNMGQLLFLDCRQFVGATTNRIFKLTGYYRIYKVTHDATRAGFSTTLTAILEESSDDYKMRGKKGKTGSTAATGVTGAGGSTGPSLGGVVMNAATGDLDKSLSSLATASNQLMVKAMSPTRVTETKKAYDQFVTAYHAMGSQAVREVERGESTEKTMKIVLPSSATLILEAASAVGLIQDAEKAIAETMGTIKLRKALIDNWIANPKSFWSANETIPFLVNIIKKDSGEVYEACAVIDAAVTGLVTLVKKVLATVDAPETVPLYALWAREHGEVRNPPLEPGTYFTSEKSPMAQVLSGLGKQLTSDAWLNIFGLWECHPANSKGYYQNSGTESKIKDLANLLCPYITRAPGKSGTAIKGPLTPINDKCPIH